MADQSIQRGLAAILAADVVGYSALMEADEDGISEDIISALRRIRSLFVIVRNSTFTYKSQFPDLRDVAKSWGRGMCWKAASAKRAIGFVLRRS